MEDENKTDKIVEKKRMKAEKMKMSRSMLDVAAYFVAKNRIHNSDDLWFGEDNQVRTIFSPSFPTSLPPSLTFFL